MEKTYYEILGLANNAVEREIRAAYHRLARKYHPDKAQEGTDPAAMEAEFSLISTAYNVLKDPEKRMAYDQNLELRRQHELNKTSASAPRSASKAASESSSSLSKAMPAGPSLDKSRASVARRAFLKGLQLLSSGDYAKSAEFFEIAIKNNDNEPSYHAKLAQTLLRGHRSFSRATEAAEKAITLDPYNSEYRLILAEIYEAVGSRTKAVQTYEAILKWDPTNERALQAMQTLQPKRSSFLERLFGRK